MGFPYHGAGWKGQPNQASPPHWCLIPQARGQVEQGGWSGAPQGSPCVTCSSLRRSRPHVNWPGKRWKLEAQVLCKQQATAGDRRESDGCIAPQLGYEARFSPTASKAWRKEAQGCFSFLGEPGSTVLIKALFPKMLRVYINLQRASKHLGDGG